MNLSDNKKHIDVLKKWIYLMVQIHESKSFLEIAKSENFALSPSSSLNELLIQQSFFKSFVLSYSKCFTQSGKGRNKLEIVEVLKNQNPEFNVTHKRIIDLRHKYVAHNDTSGLDNATIETSENEKELVVNYMYEFAIPMNEYNNYLELISIVEKYIVVKNKSIISSLEKKIGKKVLIKNV